MVAKAKKLHGSKSARTKSDKRYSKANYEFDVYDDLWQLDANKSLNFELLASLNLDPKFESNFRLALADYACEFSSSYTDNLFRYCRWFFAVRSFFHVRGESPPLVTTALSRRLVLVEVRCTRVLPGSDDDEDAPLSGNAEGVVPHRLMHETAVIGKNRTWRWGHEGVVCM